MGGLGTWQTLGKLRGSLAEERGVFGNLGLHTTLNPLP